jgi:hypothetical protein
MSLLTWQFLGQSLQSERASSEFIKEVLVKEDAAEGG